MEKRIPWNKGKKGITEKTRRKMSEAQKGKKRRPFTEKTRKRMSQARKGMKFSQEHRRNLTISRNKRTDKPMLGKKHTEEFKSRMRIIKLGTKASEKTKKKQSRSLKKAYKNPKLRKKLSDAQMGRKVLPATRRKIGAKNRMNYSTPERQEFFREKRLHQVFPAKDTIIEKMRLRIEPQIKCDPSEIINLPYVKRSLPISDKAFAETYFSGLEKAGFPE